MTTDRNDKGNDMNEFYAAEDLATRYGVHFEGHQGYIPTTEAMSLGELSDAGGRVTKVRFIGGDYIPGRGKCYDLSYTHGELPNGAQVRIEHLPAIFLTPRRALKGELIRWAKDEKVFAKGLGMLDEGNWSILG
jgi:hypothetical protein